MQLDWCRYIFSFLSSGWENFLRDPQIILKPWRTRIGNNTPAWPHEKHNFPDLVFNSSIYKAQDAICFAKHFLNIPCPLQRWYTTRILRSSLLFRIVPMNLYCPSLSPLPKCITSHFCLLNCICYLSTLSAMIPVKTDNFWKGVQISNGWWKDHTKKFQILRL